MVLQNKQKTRDKIEIVSSYQSIITLNVNKIASPIKRQRMSEWIKNAIYCLQETHFSLKYTHRLRVKGWKKTFQVNGDQISKQINKQASSRSSYI